MILTYPPDRGDLMSRAFVSENDGWGFCKAMLESCIFADENGWCTLDECRQYQRPLPPNAKPQPEN